MGPFWFTRGMAFLPIFLVIWTYLTFTISYIIAFSRGDVDPGFPYISDTGARRPESSIFGQMLNISAVTALACIYIRYKQVSGYIEQLADEKFKIVNLLNKIGLVCGILISLGMSLVANFQETSVLTVHIIGACLTFFLGSIYGFIHSFITYKMHPEINGKCVFYVRLAISIISVAALIGVYVAVEPTPKFHWHPSDPGYQKHLASTIFEWILAASFLAYFYTYIRDFQQITIRASTHLHQDTLHHDQSQQLQDEMQQEDIVA